MKNITLLLITIALVSCGKMTPNEVVEAVRANEALAVEKWINSGGNPDMTINGASLLYIATGPKGGVDVVTVLLESGADPNQGAGKYTPLMNAASWAALDAVKLLVKHGVDASRMNSMGQTALECVGLAGGAERLVINFLDSINVGQQGGQPDAASRYQLP